MADHDGDSQAMQSAQPKCPHPWQAIVSHGQPEGNYDTCDDCGKVFPRSLPIAAQTADRPLPFTYSLRAAVRAHYKRQVASEPNAEELARRFSDSLSEGEVYDYAYDALTKTYPTADRPADPHDTCENSRDCVECGKRIAPSFGVCFTCATKDWPAALAEDAALIRDLREEADDLPYPEETWYAKAADRLSERSAQVRAVQAWCDRYDSDIPIANWTWGGICAELRHELALNRGEPEANTDPSAKEAGG